MTKHLCLGLTLFALNIATARAGNIPSASGTALDGHAVSLPRDLSPHATILILGFTKDSKDYTTAWERPIRSSLANPSIAYFDIPFLEDAPSLARPLILRGIRKEVPDVLKPRFVPLTSGESLWKQTVGFTPSTPDAAYVLLVDRTGAIRWQTHTPYSPTLFDQLATEARRLAAN